MIGLDSSILVRFFAQDDPIQTPKADVVMRSLSPETVGYIPTVALAELIWVMGSNFGARRPVIARIVEHLIQSELLIVESKAVVKSALQLFIVSSSDFADCLILRTCQRIGCEHTTTFDRKASRMAGMRLIE